MSLPSRTASPPFGRYQIMLPGDSGTRGCEQHVWSRYAATPRGTESRTRDRYVACRTTHALPNRAIRRLLRDAETVNRSNIFPLRTLDTLSTHRTSVIRHNRYHPLRHQTPLHHL